MKTLRHLAPALLLTALSATKILSAGELLPVINPTFANVPILCSLHYAYQVTDSGTCTDQYPQQPLNGVSGIGWTFSEPLFSIDEGTGLTGPETGFNPPSFAGLPFRQAAFLRGTQSKIAQIVPGFVAEQPYRMSFYLGSRYASGLYDGNQTVVALVDDHIIDVWTLVSYTPFTLRSVLLKVGSSGPHTLKFVGTADGDHTAFFSGVTIEAVSTGETE